MSESVRPRFAVDLNDIERQLAQTQGVPAQPASASRNDPLAELDRIVGQDDPFQTLLANDGAQHLRKPASSIDDLFAVGGPAAGASRPAQPPLRAVQTEPTFDHGHYPQAAARGAEPAYAYQPEASAQSQGHGAYDDGAYDQDYFDEGSSQAASDYGAPEALDYPPLQQRRSRKGMIAIGAVLGAVVLGVGGAYVLTGKSTLTGRDGPPLIKANNEPTKVQPQNPGGVEIPNQNKQIYERASQTGETKVVNREEQPVDVKQAVRANGGTVADATGATVPAGGQSAGGLNLGEPKKVRTVSIRPDGTVVRPEAANAPRPGAAPVPAMTLPQAAQAQPAAATPASVQVASAQPTPAAARPAASTPAAAPAAPVQKPVPAAATPASGASPQKVAAVPPAPAAPVASSDGATGGYVVQLGLANSEAAAGTTLAQLQRKFPDLDGAPSMIRKAEVNGNTIYRVRVGPFSKEEASSLCSKVQGQGGQCFVAKN